MKLIKSTLFFLAFSVSIAIAKPGMVYTFNFEASVIHVSLRYNPIEKNSTVFEYGHKHSHGVSSSLKDLVNLQSNVTFKTDSANNSITFFHPANDIVLVQYDIINTHINAQKSLGDAYKPIITDSYIFSFSNALFLKPILNNRQYHKMKMSVQYTAAKAFPLFFSFAPTLQPKEEVTINLHEGINGVVCGASNLHMEERITGGTKNYIVLCEQSEASQNLPSFMNYIDTFIPTLSEFWGKTQEKVYTIIASPFFDQNHNHISSIAFKAGCHIKYSGDKILTNQEAIISVSREMMQKFIGSDNLAMNSDNQWFNKGFTDYNTWLLLKYSGLISEMDLKNTLSDTYRNLLKNPASTIPKSEILNHSWNNHEDEKLPYQRGALFAAYINKQISSLNEEGKTYQSFMRSLMNRSIKKNRDLTPKDFLKVASNYLPKKEIEHALQEYIMAGRFIPPSQIL
ncbi:hypothetical protein [Fulvivirga sediminis]|uniref:Peptidase M1 membrane alanine aminopeptidase domain-containing protein n=1 Tax=Fulvivirga sediminis TaxID=2803949 RepID=A0A937F6F8_9BACT|nr:hypothetical protein [Fulvivirga sediminis]MBL3655891.1 hypothetical protein [Fulvivirga sediminis]